MAMRALVNSPVRDLLTFDSYVHDLTEKRHRGSLRAIAATTIAERSGGRRERAGGRCQTATIPPRVARSYQGSFVTALRPQRAATGQIVIVIALEP